MLFFKNEYFAIKVINEILFIQVFKLGFPMQAFNSIMQKYPRITVTKFMALKEALEGKVSGEIEFGRLKEKFTLNVSPDNLEAKIYINLDHQTFEDTKEAIKEEILKLLNHNHIVHGILHEVIDKKLQPQKHIVIAKGTPVEPGEDAKIVYLEMPEKKPTLNSDGSTNYYDMNLFKYVYKGDWLGEKVLIKPGKKGKTIKGLVLFPEKRKDQYLRFDPESVETTELEDKIVLSAKFDGALRMIGGKIGVVSHLVIHSNVGYGTGNIDFDGYVTVEGTVEDGFSVIATNDISILSNLGIGAINKIHSKEGNVYIKGGVSGKGRASIEAGGSVFMKYANSCTIKAKDIIDVGYYVLDSHLEAGTIFVQAKNGKTIGGTIKAKTKVSLRMVGNVYEKETYINVEGFNRNEIKNQLDSLLINYKALLKDLEESEKALKLYERTIVRTEKTGNDGEYEKKLKTHQQLIDKLYFLEDERRKLVDILLSKGDGEVAIFDVAYPSTFLEIKRTQKRIEQITTGTFYAQDNEMKRD
ncbi:MAG: hypothetical protein K0S71_2346 [Clostridia bacterium]|jgi:uncharacterized protein (DUF342 family)|nr:hypothetical protein [Clostridia bacterium]